MNGNLNSCSVSVSSANIYPQINEADESYTLSIAADGTCKIESNEIWGAMHAMETFTQLLERNIETKQVFTTYAPATVKDSPRFPHRGLMIDTSRHYLTVSAIKKMIDILPMSKFNTLHIHLVDAQSFPFDSPSAPEIVKGAYSSKLTYTQKDLMLITEYAAERGVRMIFEIDVPGHAASWNAGYPKVMADCFEKYSYNINDFALNPAVDDTYTVLNAVLGDLVKATNSSLVHIGGDEVVYGYFSVGAAN